MGERGDEETVPRLTPHGALSWSHRPRHLGPRGTFSWSHPGTTKRYPWSHPGTTPPFCGTTRAVFVGPPVVLGPNPWSPRGPSFHTGNRACGTTVVPPLYLGVGTTPGPSTTATRDHPWSPFLHHDKLAPRAATGREVGARHPGSRPIGDGDEDADARRLAHQVLGGERRRQRTHDPLGVLIDRRAAHALHRQVLAIERLTIGTWPQRPSSPAA